MPNPPHSSLRPAVDAVAVQPSCPTALGKYEVLRRLAVGGMAEILLARSTGIEGFIKHVVIKRILPQYASEERFVAMFVDEARLAACLHHQNIAQVYDIGVEDGEFFFAMEYIHGEDVGAVLARSAATSGRLPLGHALTIASGIASGLAYAHEKLGPDGRPLGIVHRDISPSNVLVTYDGGVKIVDFGIARAAIRSSETRTGAVKGKLSYMSPEQCLGDDLDHRSDIFSLGVVLYELTTCTRLFRHDPDDSDYIVMNRIVTGKVPRPAERVPDYPPELEEIVMKALDVAPERRYQSARDLLIDVEAFASQERISLSSTALSRHIIEMFGERPEPWRDDADTVERPAPGDWFERLRKGRPASEPEIPPLDEARRNGDVGPAPADPDGPIGGHPARVAPMAAAAAPAAAAVPAAVTLAPTPGAPGAAAIVAPTPAAPAPPAPPAEPAYPTVGAPPGDAGAPARSMLRRRSPGFSEPSNSYSEAWFAAEPPSDPSYRDIRVARSARRRLLVGGLVALLALASAAGGFYIMSSGSENPAPGVETAGGESAPAVAPAPAPAEVPVGPATPVANRKDGPTAAPRPAAAPTPQPDESAAGTDGDTAATDGDTAATDDDNAGDDSAGDDSAGDDSATAGDGSTPSDPPPAGSGPTAAAVQAGAKTDPKTDPKAAAKTDPKAAAKTDPKAAAAKKDGAAGKARPTRTRKPPVKRSRPPVRRPPAKDPPKDKAKRVNDLIDTKW